MHTLWGVLSYFHCLVFSYGRAKTIRIRYVWTRIFLKTEEKIFVVFKQKRIRVDGAQVSNANDSENIKNYAGVSTFEINWKVPFKYQLKTENM